MEVVELRAWGGGQVDSDGHGDVTLGARSGAWSAHLYTETLDLRWAPEGERGRAFVAARGEVGAAGLFISPWTDGAPDPGRAFFASQAGVEGGAQRYFDGGVYLGAQARGARWWFGALRETEVVLPPPAWVFGGEVVGGVYRPAAQVELRFGADLADTGLIVGAVEPMSSPAPAPAWGFQPRVGLDARWHPGWTVAPRVELRGALADGQDELTRTRLGGLTPYVVPLAGAAWAEWRVEDYAAARLGADAGGEALRGGLVADLAAFDGPGAVGFAATAEGRWKQGYADLAVGWAPWIPRQEGVSRWSLYFRLGVDWVPLRSSNGNRPPSEPAPPSAPAPSAASGTMATRRSATTPRAAARSR